MTSSRETEPDLYSGTGSKSFSPVLLVAIFSLICISLIVQSLQWRLFHDLPLMLYYAFLIEEFAYVPYLDFFDMHAPGAFFFYRILYRLGGHSDLAYRLLDLVCLLGIGASIALFSKPWGRTCAILGPLFFSITYLARGPGESLQREYLALLPISLGLVAAFRLESWPLSRRAFLTGVFIAIASAIKPPLILFLLLIIAAQVGPLVLGKIPVRHKLAQGLWLSSSALAGSALIILLLLVHLQIHGALTSFLDIVKQYWPLYVEMGGDGSIPEPGDYKAQLVRMAIVIAYCLSFPFLLLAAIGGFRIAKSLVGVSPAALPGDLLVVLGAPLASLLYLWTSNKLWTYHTLPLFFSLSLLAALAFADHTAGLPSLKRFSRPKVLFSVAMICLILGGLIQSLREKPLREYREDGLDRVDTITHFLEENMKEGDRVLPLDVVGGAVSAMFRTRARLAGLFQYDFFFYHHCENPFIRKLRRRFVETFDRDKPAFIIRFRERWTPSGPGTCETFEELEERLTRDYELALAHEGFLILKRIRLGKAGSGS